MIKLFPVEFEITKSHREQLKGHAAFTLWLTGLSGSGKTTLANGIDKWLHERGMHSFVLDGDNTRTGINSDLDFSVDGRTENLRRVAHICKLFNDAGTIAIASFISPAADDRARAKAIIGSENFIEVYLDASVGTCMTRDKKGLYALAQAGKLHNFTGVNSAYDEPEHPHLVIDSNSQSIAENTAQLVAWLTKHKL